MQGRRFAQGLCWQKLFWVLVAGSVFGVAWEHCVNLLLHGRFYGGRGLVWGPFNLVYGCGAVLLTLLLWPLRDGQAHKLLLAGMLAGSAYEVGCSLLQEAVFGTVSWNYDRELLPLLGGRTTLPVAFAWGLLAVFYMKAVYPRLSRLIERIPPRWGRALTLALLIFLTVDALVSLLAVGRMAARRAALPAQGELDLLLDFCFPDHALRQIFPGMKFI